MKSSEIIQTNYHAPDGLRIYAIGDVHGYRDALESMHDAIADDLLQRPPKHAHIVYLGDYVDRGPDSKGVIDYLITRRDRGDGIDKTFLLGNHEAAMMYFYASNDSDKHARWLKWGGVETVQSYGIDVTYPDAPAAYARASDAFRAALPPAHVDFLAALQTHVMLGDYVFAHAGTHPETPLHKQKKGHLLTMREPFLNWEHPVPFCTVHGHTISETPQVKHHRIGVDTGLYAGGKLTAAVIEGSGVRFLEVSG